MSKNYQYNMLDNIAIKKMTKLLRMADKNKGFTLIELLVVIAIIGLLASIVLVSLNSSRAKARDARRFADFKQIRAALEMYYDKNGNYPNYGGCKVSTSADFLQELVTAGFLQQIPKDPINTNPPPESNRYRYEYCAPLTYSCGTVAFFQMHMEAEDPQDETSCGNWSGDMWFEATWPF